MGTCSISRLALSLAFGLASLNPLTAEASGSTDGAPDLVPGQKVVLPVELEKREIRWIKSSGLSGYEQAEAAIALPKDFAPGRPYPILITCVTGDRYLTNIEEMDKYWPAAVEAGWVVVTGWAPPSPQPDTRAYRRAVTVAALRTLQELIPASVDWPLAVGGFSGGAKNAAVTAAYLAQEGRSLIGLFMGGCNRDLATYALKKIAPDANAFRQIPLFLSNGEADTVSTLAEAHEVRESLRKSGFASIRLGTYPGGHVLHQAHLHAALDWFSGRASGASSTK